MAPSKNQAIPQVEELYKSQGTNPYNTALYKAWLPRAKEQINSDYASRGLYDSGLAANAQTEAQANMAANIYQHQFENRLNTLNLLGNLYGQSVQNGGGGYSGGGVASGGGDSSPGWYSSGGGYDQMRDKMTMQQQFKPTTWTQDTYGNWYK
jgi:hypothetical protein